MPELRIAIVGAGAAGLYAIQHLLEQTTWDVKIDLFERLPTPWGLVRSGVAPDHPEKKQIIDRLFAFFLRDERVRLIANVAVGSDIGHEALAARYHAVIYAVGADDDKMLGIEGESLSGSWSAREFVAWYNGHPAYRHLPVDLSAPRAVIVGTGNVALDVARILTLPIAQLAKTDIADHALDALRRSQICDVVLLGRGGCRQAAFHSPELEELLHLDTVEVRIEADDLTLATDEACHRDMRRKLDILARLQQRQCHAPDKRMTFKFHHTPISVAGSHAVEGLNVAISGASPKIEMLPCGLLLRAIGYRGRPIEGLPFDIDAGIVTHFAGRVQHDGQIMTGAYVTGWIKRGPKGVIGSNKYCAAETVGSVLDDANAGRLAINAQDDVMTLLTDRGCCPVLQEGWRHIDEAERRAGRPSGRPRVKLTHMAALLNAAQMPGQSMPTEAPARNMSRGDHD